MGSIRATELHTCRPQGRLPESCPKALARAADLAPGAPPGGMFMPGGMFIPFIICFIAW
jgi:hypothetical protein